MYTLRLQLAVSLLITACGGTPPPHDAASAAWDLETTEGQPSGDVVTRRIARSFEDIPGDVWIGVISPDGRHLLLPNPHDLSLVEIGSGEQRVVRRFEEGGAWSVMGGPRFSRDGRQIAYRVRHPEEWIVELRVIDVDGTGERVLSARPNELIHQAYPVDFSPDGRTILSALQYTGMRRQIALVPTDGGPYTVLRSVDWGGFEGPRFSPDGRFIAYGLPTTDGPAADIDLFVLSVDGTREERITTDGGRKQMLGWTASGDGLLYHMREPNGTTALFRVPVRSGSPAGPVRMVRSDLAGFRALDLHGDSLFYLVEPPAVPRQIYQLGVDLDSGQATGAATVTSSQSSILDSTSPTWSPDGARFAYIRGADPRTNPGIPEIVIRSVASGTERTIHSPVARLGKIEWTADGRLRAAGPTERDAGAVLFQYDFGSGEWRRNDAFPPATGTFRTSPRSPDGGRRYFVSRLRPGEFEIVYEDAQTGESTTLVRTGGARARFLSLSADGRLLTFVEEVDPADGGVSRERLWVVPTNHDEPRVVHVAPEGRLVPGSLPAAENRQLLLVSADNRHVLFAEWGAGDEDARTAFIKAVSTSGGPARVLATLSGLSEIGGLSLSPDGRTLLYSARPHTPDAPIELWVMSNLSGADETGAGSGG